MVPIQLFNPSVYFVLPELNGTKIEFIGGTKAQLCSKNTRFPDAKVQKVAQVCRQDNGRVNATERVVQNVRDKLQRTTFMSPTEKLEAEQSLLKFVAGIKEKIAQSLAKPFMYICSWICGGIGRLVSLEGMLTKDLYVTAQRAQQEQIRDFYPYCKVMSDKKAARALKDALRGRDDTKAWTLRMDANKPSTFFLVEAVREQSGGEYTIRESEITLYESLYTLNISDSNPHHSSLQEYREDLTRKNEWACPEQLMDELKGIYGTLFL